MNFSWFQHLHCCFVDCCEFGHCFFELTILIRNTERHVVHLDMLFNEFIDDRLQRFGWTNGRYAYSKCESCSAVESSSKINGILFKWLRLAQTLQFTYCGTAFRLVWVGNMLGTLTLCLLCLCDSRAKNESSIPKVKCAKQYCVSYDILSRSMWKHCENEPNALKFPLNIPAGILAHASNTVMSIF